GVRDWPRSRARHAACGRGAAGGEPPAPLLPYVGSTPHRGKISPIFRTPARAGVRRRADCQDRLCLSGGQHDKFPTLAAECLRLRPDVIVVTTTPAAQAAKNATRTLPIVMIPLGDPVGTGLVASLSRPGNNVTGQTFMASGLAAKRLE